MSEPLATLSHNRGGRNTRRILRAYAAADDATRERGRRWYPAARAIAAELSASYSVPLPRAIDAIAAASPRNSWAGNLADARAIFELSADPLIADIDPGADGVPSPIYGLPGFVRRAHRIARGVGTLDDQFKDAPKVRAFAAAIAGDANSVVVDAWAARVACGRHSGTVTPASYRRIADAYRNAAVRCGETPRDLQAITWLQVRGTRGQAKRDPEVRT